MAEERNMVAKDNRCTDYLKTMTNAHISLFFPSNSFLPLINRSDIKNANCELLEGKKTPQYRIVNPYL